MLGKRLADALGDTAADLALECQFIDDGADIVDDDIAQRLGRAGFGIDLDLADMAAVREVRDLGEKLATS